MKRIMLSLMVLALVWAAPASGLGLRTGSGDSETSLCASLERQREGRRLADRAVSEYTSGNYKTCDRLMERLDAQPKDTGEAVWVELAAIQTCLAQKETAVASLEQAVKAGLHEKARVEEDVVFSPLSEKDIEGVLENLGRAEALRNPKTDAEKQRRAGHLASLNRELVSLFEKNDYDSCLRVIQHILDIDPDDGTAWYNLACVQCLQRDFDLAMESLEWSVEKGFISFRHMEHDEDLEALKERPEYLALLDRRDEFLKASAIKDFQDMQEELGDEYLFEIDHDEKIIFATNVDRFTLDALKRHLTTYAAAQHRDLFDNGFERYLRIVIPKRWPRGPIGGYYRRTKHLLKAKNVGMTLTHEFTHALHFADMGARGQDHPIWVAEGLATLFESSSLVDGQAVPEVNRRLNLLKRLVSSKRHIPWRRLMKLSRGHFMRQAGPAYAQSRYLMMYLHEQGKLREWYDAYTAGFEKDGSGIAAFEQVFGKKLEAVEKDWLAWVKGLESLPTGLRADQPRLGIRPQGVRDGIMIRGLTIGGAAARAGLQLGDVIVEIDGQRVGDTEKLIHLLTGRKFGEKLDVRYRRLGKYDTTTVILAPEGEEPLPDSHEESSTQEPPEGGAEAAPTTRPAKKAA